MEMIDGRRFKRGASLDEQALREIAVRRLKADLRGRRASSRASWSRSRSPPTRTRCGRSPCSTGSSPRAPGQAGAAGRRGIVAMLLKKRFLSSPVVFRAHAGHYAAADGGGSPAIDDEDEYYQEVLGSEQSDEEEGAAEQPEFTALRRSKGSDPLVSRRPARRSRRWRWGRATSTGRTAGWRR